MQNNDDARSRERSSPAEFQRIHSLPAGTVRSGRRGERLLA